LIERDNENEREIEWLAPKRATLRMIPMAEVAAYL